MPSDEQDLPVEERLAAIAEIFARGVHRWTVDRRKMQGAQSRKEKTQDTGGSGER